MQEEYKQRRMTMDFSQLHTYTPPQCAPENTGYTYSLSSSYSTAALEFEKEHRIAPVYESPRMSRRSLRLQTGAGLYGTDGVNDFSQNQNHSSSSSYTTTRRETRTLRSRKLQSGSKSTSLSLSQTATPRKTLSFSTVCTPASGGSVQESSAVLLSADGDETHLRQRTAATTATTDIDGLWGRSSSVDHGSTNVNGDVSFSASKSHSSFANGYICKDCSFHSQSTESLAEHASSPSCQAAESSGDLLSSPSRFTSIYSRDRSSRSKSGVLSSVSSSCVHLGRRALAPIVTFVAFLYAHVLRLGSRASAIKGVLTSFSDSLRQTVSSSWHQLWLLKQTTLHRMMGYRKNATEGQAHSSYCGSLNVRDLVTEDASHLSLNGSLCDDCKGKQYSETHTVLVTQPSRPRRLAGALWTLLAYAGYCLLQTGDCVVRAGKSAGSGVVAVAQRTLYLLWMLLTAPVKACRGLLWFLTEGWYRFVSLVSLLNVYFLTRCLPKLWKLLLLLLPLLLLLALWLWGPSTAALLAYLPAINLTEWRPASPVTFLSRLMPASASAPASDSIRATEAPPVQTPAALTHTQAPPVPPPAIVSAVDLERLERVERQLALLWERVRQGDQTQDERYADVTALYGSLREKIHAETDREKLEVWVSSLLEQKLGLLKGDLEQEKTLRAQGAEQQALHHQSQTARLAGLETLLAALTAKTEGLQQKQQQYEHQLERREEEEVPPAEDTVPLSVAVKQEDHDALLAEVQKLELELGKVRRDLQGVAGCKGKCEQLDSLQDTIHAQVSSQVRRELRALFFGSQGAGDERGELPESLVLWLSQRYAGTSDLQASLAALEQSVLRNVSLQLELNEARTLGELEARTKSIAQTVTGAVRSTVSTEGLTEEQVKLIVQNALRLYSQDRTGLVDYALESGGGSILSTRCSETYETKTALMSLFGLPLWYFSQSPRVVIQPDVYPGNCWAFKGSQGYLVIRLSLRILPTSFCVEHIPKALSPTGNITSAPRNFTVFGLDDEYQEEGRLLGQYTYQEDGESLQTFAVQEHNDKAFQIIEVRVLSNWGHPEYTCLYRFRVHGEPRPQ